MVSLFERREMASAVGLPAKRARKGSLGRSALIFSTDDVDAWAARLRRKKVRLLQGPTNRPTWQLRTIHFLDPDGYLIEIFSGMK